ncbi:MAG TPA: hypothetical protein VIG24_03340, partial [Acidimicrobiia bacterium]
MADVSAHYDGSAPSYHEQYDPDLIWKNAEYPANYFRLQKVIEILRERGVSSVYDLGAGEASPIIAIREALGVIPHVEDDSWFVEAMSLFLKPGGTLILQFRNSMFSMFTFNRLTKEYILEELMAPVPQKFKDVVAADLDQRLAVDKPPIRRRDDGHGYDEILSKFNNPFELAEVVKAQGFTDLSYRWYNFHPTYPMV